MPRQHAPQTVGELDVWWQEQLGSDRTFLTESARAVGRSIATKLHAAGVGPRADARRDPRPDRIAAATRTPGVRPRMDPGETMPHSGSSPQPIAQRGHCSPSPSAAAPACPSTQPSHARSATTTRTGKTGFDLPDDLQARARSDLAR